MTIIFQQSKKYRDLSLFDITDQTEEEAWLKLKQMRWGNGEQVCCPDCKTWDKHYFISARKKWTCKKCSHRFSVTSSTPFSSCKLTHKKLLVIIFCFISASQGMSANEFHSIFGVSLKTIFHNLGKIREVLYETMDRSQLEGIVHIDCAHFCGKPRRANIRKKSDSYVINNHLRNRKDGIVPDKSTHPEPWNLNKLKNRRVLLAMSQIDASKDEKHGSNRTICVVIKQEKRSSIIPLIKKFVSPDALIMTDSGNAFSSISMDLNNLHFAVNHSREYMTSDGVSNNMAESFFSRVRRAEFGTYNGMRPQYLAFYAAEFAWRNDSKHLSLQQKFEDVLKRICTRETSKAFCNYNHGHRLGFEYVSD